MKYLVNNSNDPKYNLALEEYVLKELMGEYFFLWQNSPTIVIGKHQNTHAEINAEYIEENNINVVRRMSGGGAVYHDLGNVNFSFIQDKNDISEFDFGFFTEPIVAVLKSMGVIAEFNSRNDLAIDGKKFSGNAQYIYKKRILHHGTLLFDSELAELSKSLKVSKDKIESKGLKSVRSRVTNIKEHINESFGIGDVKIFQNALLNYMRETMDNFEEYKLNDEDIRKIMEIKSEKYDTWEWNYGESPEADIHRQRKGNSGKIESFINVKDGVIKNIKLYGDFFSGKDTGEVESGLTGIRYNKEDIIAYLNKINVETYFSGFTTEEILDVII